MLSFVRHIDLDMDLNFCISLNCLKDLNLWFLPLSYFNGFWWKLRNTCFMNLFGGNRVPGLFKFLMRSGVWSCCGRIDYFWMSSSRSIGRSGSLLKFFYAPYPPYPSLKFWISYFFLSSSSSDSWKRLLFCYWPFLTSSIDPTLSEQELYLGLFYIWKWFEIKTSLILICEFERRLNKE